MSYFSPSLASYIDATLGWDFGSYDALKAVFEQYMPGWAPPPVRKQRRSSAVVISVRSQREATSSGSDVWIIICSRNVRRDRSAESGTSHA